MNAPFVLSCRGPKLSNEERKLFEDVRPWGFILFSRNCRSDDQTKNLVKELRECSKSARILIDEEGGKVTRLPYRDQAKKPPAAAQFGRLYESEPQRALRLAEESAAATARRLAGLGIDINCAPVLDLAIKGGHQVIGNRSFGREPQTVIALAKAVRTGFAANRVEAVIKHIPGHGRAAADSHQTLPRVDASFSQLKKDAEPFAALSDSPMAMTAHVLYSAIDKKNPATCSTEAVKFIRWELGFKGLLITDALEMKALSGELAERADSAFQAGCDIALYGGGKLEQMKEMLANSRYK